MFSTLADWLQYPSMSDRPCEKCSCLPSANRSRHGQGDVGILLEASNQTCIFHPSCFRIWSFWKGSRQTKQTTGSGNWYRFDWQNWTCPTRKCTYILFRINPVSRLGYKRQGSHPGNQIVCSDAMGWRQPNATAGSSPLRTPTGTAPDKTAK